MKLQIFVVGYLFMSVFLVTELLRSFLSFSKSIFYMDFDSLAEISFPFPIFMFTFPYTSPSIRQSKLPLNSNNSLFHFLNSISNSKNYERYQTICFIDKNTLLIIFIRHVFACYCYTNHGTY